MQRKGPIADGFERLGVVGDRLRQGLGVGDGRSGGPALEIEQLLDELPLETPGGSAEAGRRIPRHGQLRQRAVGPGPPGGDLPALQAEPGDERVERAHRYAEPIGEIVDGDRVRGVIHAEALDLPRGEIVNRSQSHDVESRRRRASAVGPAASGKPSGGSLAGRPGVPAGPWRNSSAFLLSTRGACGRQGLFSQNVATTVANGAIGRGALLQISFRAAANLQMQSTGSTTSRSLSDRGSSARR